jgi:Fe-S oxidoreductase
MSTSLAPGSKAKPPGFSYASTFETVRTVGSLLAPPDLQWLTEIPRDAPESQIVLHLSCMAHYTPHIPLLGQRILQRIGLDCVIVGGPENCCGTLHAHFGDEDLARTSVKIAISGFRRMRPRKVVSICPDCDEIFAEHARGQMPFEPSNISSLFVEHLDVLAPLMRPLPLRAIAHVHRVNPSRRADASNMLSILKPIPGLELIDAPHSGGPGLHCQTLHPMSDADQLAMFEEARSLGAEALIVPYHSCYRQHCKMQISHGVEVHHYFGILARSLGIPFEEPFKTLRLMDDIEAALDALQPRIEQLGYDRNQVRSYLARTVYR